MAPAVRSSSPAMQLSAVDLPQPLGPNSETNVPPAISKLKSTSAFAVPKARVIPCNSSFLIFSIADPRYVLEGLHLVAAYPASLSWMSRIQPHKVLQPRLLIWRASPSAARALGRP